MQLLTLDFIHLFFYLCCFDVLMNNVSSPGCDRGSVVNKMPFSFLCFLFYIFLGMVLTWASKMLFSDQPLGGTLVILNCQMGRGVLSWVDLVQLTHAKTYWANASLYLSMSWTQILHLHTPMTMRCTLPCCIHRPTPQLNLGRPTTPLPLPTLAAPASESLLAQVIHWPAQGKLWCPSFPNLGMGLHWIHWWVYTSVLQCRGDAVWVKVLQTVSEHHRN